jgi:hypothetical protein
MKKSADLRAVTPDEFVEALSFALRFKGRKPFPQSNTLMAQITAEHLVEHLQRCGFRLMKEPDAIAPSTTHHMAARGQEPDQQ